MISVVVNSSELHALCLVSVGTSSAWLVISWRESIKWGNLHVQCRLIYSQVHHTTPKPQERMQEQVIEGVEIEISAEGECVDSRVEAGICVNLAESRS